MALMLPPHCGVLFNPAAATFLNAAKRHRNMIICLKLQFIISFLRLRHGQSHPAHSYRIKPGFSFDVSGFFTTNRMVYFKRQLSEAISSGITIDRSTVLHSADRGENPHSRAFSFLIIK
jgi:hypothetical protein